MPAEVKRTYDSSLRRGQSAETRQRILDAARDLIVQRGYRATTIAAVADRAAVNIDTVYDRVGRKPVILRELIEQAISGTDRAVVAEDRDYVKAIVAEPDPANKLAMYARAVAAIQERMAPLFLALRDAASTEPEARAVWQEIDERRAANMRTFAESLHVAGGLRAGLTVEEAADVIWTTASSDVYALFVVQRHWTRQRFERWLADTWRRLLLE
jgi:AcrR family transcriptional regulator